MILLVFNLLLLLNLQSSNALPQVLHQGNKGKVALGAKKLTDRQTKYTYRQTERFVFTGDIFRTVQFSLGYMYIESGEYSGGGGSPRM